MNIIDNALVIIVFCVIAVAVISAAMTISPNLVQIQSVSKYDCGMAEWHPDIPQNVRDQCRKQRAK